MPALPDRAGLHMAQAALALDPVAGMETARVLAQGRIVSARSVLMGWRTTMRRRLGRGGDAARMAATEALLARADSTAEAMRMAAAKCTIASDRASLMGLEGHAIRRYYGVWRRSLPAWAPAERSRRPARDAPNALLNYLTAMLQRDIELAVRRAGLHPGLGEATVSELPHSVQVCQCRQPDQANGETGEMVGRKLPLHPKRACASLYSTPSGVSTVPRRFSPLTSEKTQMTPDHPSGGARSG